MLLYFANQADCRMEKSVEIDNSSSSETIGDKSAIAKGAVQASAGYLNFTQELFSISTGAGFGAQIGIDYSNVSVYNTVRQSNKYTPTGILGLGWQYSIPRIVVDHNGTVSLEDDKWYYLDEDGASHKIEMDLSTHKGRIPGLLNYTIEYKKADNSSTDNTNNIIVGWEMIVPDGNKYKFGDYENSNDRNACSITYQSSGEIGLFTNYSEAYIDAWYLKILTNPNESRSINLSYMALDNGEITGEVVKNTNGKIATRAMYLEEINSSNGDQIDFVYEGKDPSEYADPTDLTSEPDIYHDRYEIQFLRRLLLKRAGNTYRQYVFDYGINEFINITSGDAALLNTAYNKRFLKQIILQDGNNIQLTPSIKFVYSTGFINSTRNNSGVEEAYVQPAVGFGSISGITNQSGLVTTFNYAKIEDTYPIYQDKKPTIGDNNIPEPGNLSDLGTALGTSLPQKMNGRSQIIEGAGFIVINEYYRDGNWFCWKPNFFASIDSGFRPLNDYSADAIKYPLPTELHRESMVMAFGDRMIVYFFNASSQTYDSIDVFKYENNRFEKEVKLLNCRKGTFLQFSGNRLLYTVPSATNSRYKTVYLIEDKGNGFAGALSSPTAPTNVLWSDASVLVYKKHYFDNNLIVIRDRMSISAICLTENAMVGGGTELKMKNVQIRDDDNVLKDNIDNIADVVLVGTKLALKKFEAVTHKKYYYTLFAFDGDNFEKITDVKTIGSYTNAGILSGQDMAYFGQEYIGVTDDVNNLILFIDWHGNLVNKTDYDYLWDGGFVGLNTFFASYRKGQQNKFNFTIFNVGFQEAANIAKDELVDRVNYDTLSDKSSFGVSSTNYNKTVRSTTNKLIINDGQVVSGNWDYNHIVAGGATGFPDNNWSRFIDIDRNGLTDYVEKLDDGKWRVVFNYGNGGWISKNVAASQSSTTGPTGTFEKDQVQFIDIDGDGKKDYVERCSDGNWNVYYYRNNGASWESAHMFTATAIPGEPITMWSEYEHLLWYLKISSSGADFVDINGDGLPDFVYRNTFYSTEQCYNQWPVMSDDCEERGDDKWYVKFNEGNNVWTSSQLLFNDGHSGLTPGYHKQTFLDVDGNGFPDIVWRSAEDGWFVQYNWGNNKWSGGDYIENSKDVLGNSLEEGKGACITFLDANSDGLIDFACRSQIPTSLGFNYGNWRIYYNLGMQSNGTCSWGGSVEIPGTANVTVGIGEDDFISEEFGQFQDINGDGLYDFVYFLRTLPENVHRWVVVYNERTSFSSSYVKLEPYNTYPCDWDAWSENSSFTDINGDGLVDIVYHNTDDGKWRCSLNGNAFKNTWYLHSLNNNSFGKQFEAELITSITQSRPGETYSGTGLFYKDDEVNAAIPSQFNSLSNYFTIDNRANIVTNIKTCVLNNTGTYSISLRYGDVLNDDDITLNGSLHNLTDQYRLDGKEYSQKTYNSKGVLLGSVDTRYDSYFPYGDEALPEEFRETRPTAVVSVNNKVKSEQKYIYYTAAAGNDMLDRTVSIMPDGKHYVSNVDYSYMNSNSLLMENLNILTPTSSVWTILDEDKDDNYNAFRDRIISHSGNEWRLNQQGAVGWAPVWNWTAYFKDPINVDMGQDNSETYTIRHELYWDDFGNVIKTIDKREMETNKWHFTHVIYDNETHQFPIPVI